MKTALKLSLVLWAAMTSILAGTLWLAYLSESRQLASRREASIRAGLERLAARCSGVEADAEARCVEALVDAAPVEVSPAFGAALVLDGERRVVAHTDFLSGDFSLRGSPVNDGWAEAARIAGGYYAQRAELARVGEARLYSMPLGGRPGIAVAAYREGALASSSDWLKADLRRWFAQGAVLTAAVSMLVALGLTLTALAPLKPLAAASARIAQGDLAARVPEGDDEFGAVAAVFNRMASRLAEVDELKQSFVSKMTHDLRNPLSAMLGHADLLATGAKGPLTEEQSSELETIQSNGYRLSELINNILDVTQLEAGRMPLAPAPLELREEISSVLELLQVRADEYQVRLEAHVLPGLERVYADPQAFRRVLVNLVSNALKFTPALGTVSVLAHRGKPNEVVVTVADTGVGVPKERLGLLFTKFAQVPETKDKVRPSGGTGLGLAICKELVELHGGRVWAESEMFKGTAMHFSLPENPSS